VQAPLSHELEHAAPPPQSQEVFACETPQAGRFDGPNVPESRSPPASKPWSRPPSRTSALGSATLFGSFTLLWMPEAVTLPKSPMPLSGPGWSGVGLITAGAVGVVVELEEQP
jgi:hypothetical protein